MKKQKRMDIAIAVLALLLVVVTPFSKAQMQVAWWNTAFSVACDDAQTEESGAGEQVVFRFKLAQLWRDK